MSETIVRPTGLARVVPAGGHDPLRPASPDRSPVRHLRRVAGVREDILDWVPEERPRYSRLGLIVINTGMMAALSMVTALQRLVDAPWTTALLVASFWAFLIVVVDSWMITSTHGALSAGRVAALVPRLVIALLMSVVIAEPLLLWVFKPAVHAEVWQERNKSVSGLESRLKQCNPVDESASVLAGCGKADTLSLVTPAATRQQVQRISAERDRLRSQVDALTQGLRQREDFASRECAGRRGAGLSGREGKGFRCDQAWVVARQYRTDNRLVERQAQLDKLNADIDAGSLLLKEESRSYGQRVEQGIAERVRQERDTHRSIGLLDETAALGRLSDRDGTVRAAEWLVRLLLIAIDCLPVLAKWLGGRTAYDVLVSRQIDADKRMHAADLTVRDRRAQAVSDIGVRQTDHERDTEIQRIDQAGRTAQAEQDVELDAEIDRLAARYLNDPEAGASHL